MNVVWIGLAVIALVAVVAILIRLKKGSKPTRMQTRSEYLEQELEGQREALQSAGSPEEYAYIQAQIQKTRDEMKQAGAN